MKKAIDYLTTQFMDMDRCARNYAVNKAYSLYEEIKPFNLEMIIEVDDNRFYGGILND